MASALDDLVNKFKANQGSMPQVNPPAAAKVLETQTKPEVAGQKSEPTAASAAVSAQTPPAAPASAAKPAESEPEGKPRRTAAVVQAELDQALAELAQTKAALSAAHARIAEVQTEHQQTGAQRDVLQTELEKAVKFAEQVVSDNAKLSEAPATSCGATTIESAAAFLKTRGFGIFTLGGE